MMESNGKENPQSGNVGLKLRTEKSSSRLPVVHIPKTKSEYSLPVVYSVLPVYKAFQRLIKVQALPVMDSRLLVDRTFSQLPKQKNYR